MVTSILINVRIILYNVMYTYCLTLHVTIDHFREVFVDPSIAQLVERWTVVVIRYP